MGEILDLPHGLSLGEVNAAIAFAQPSLRAVRNGAGIVVSGTYLLTEPATPANPAGPIASFDIEIVLPASFPRREPKLFEVGGRIPRCPDRHINPDGDCCVTVWEHWLVCAEDHSFGAYLYGPVYEYFLSQYWFEKTGKWPFGERAHGSKGLQAAYAEALGVPNKKADLIYHLRLLSQDWPKGHWLCPCGNGKLLRHCHRDEMMALHRRIAPRIARRMLYRLREQERITRPRSVRYKSEFH